MTTAATITAEKLAAGMQAEITSAAFAPRVWSPSDADFARIYTGSRNEYIQVNADGSITTSQPRISWGHNLRDVADAMGLEVA